MEEYEMVDVITRECDNCSISSNFQNNIIPSSTNIFKKRNYSQSGMNDEQNTFQSKKLRIGRSFENIEGPKLLPELLVNHIIPHVAKDWLCVSKKWSKVAYEKLNFDPRVNLNWRSLERAICCNSVPGVLKHVNPTTLREHSISVWYILDVAIENDSSVIAKHILDDPRMADCNTLSEKLWKAVRWDRPVIVALLLKHPAIDPIQSGARAVSLAINLGRDAVLDTLRQDARVRQAEAASALTSPWVMPPQPFPRFGQFNGSHFSIEPLRFPPVHISMPLPRLPSGPLQTSRPRPDHSMEIVETVPLPRPSMYAPPMDISTVRHELLRAVVSNQEESVKKILKDEFDSIPLNILQDAANLAIQNLHYKLTNLIQQAINRRTKMDVSEPKVL